MPELESLTRGSGCLEIIQIERGDERFSRSMAMPPRCSLSYYADASSGRFINESDMAGKAKSGGHRFPCVQEVLFNDGATIGELHSDQRRTFPGGGHVRQPDTDDAIEDFANHHIHFPPCRLPLTAQ